MAVPAQGMSDKQRDRVRKLARGKAYAWRSLMYAAPAAAVSHAIGKQAPRLTAAGALVGAGLGMIDKRVEEVANTDPMLKRELRQHLLDTPGAAGDKLFKKFSSSKDELGQLAQMQLTGTKKVAADVNEASSRMAMFFGRR